MKKEENEIIDLNESLDEDKILDKEEDTLKIINEEGNFEELDEQTPKKSTGEKKKKEKKKKMSLAKKMLIIFLSLFILGAGSGAFLLYGPWPYFRELLITTAMTTMNHQYLATWFYSQETIEKVLAKNKVIEVGEDSNPDLITIKNPDKNQTIYASKYEEQILKKDHPDDIYKLIDIKESSYKGYLVVVYDPSKVKVATSKYMGRSGEMLTQIAKDNDALVAINASGFDDPDWNSNGGLPHGAVIKDGKIVWTYARASVGGGIAGFTKDNKFILGRMSAQEAIDMGVRDAIEFGPFLIVNGKSSFIKGNGGWGIAPRTAIGQRKDGIVLMLVIDGRQVGSLGADMSDLAEIMERYGAYNAVNLDGGTSSGLVIDGQLINKPINGAGQALTRPIPNAFIVTK